MPDAKGTIVVSIGQITNCSPPTPQRIKAPHGNWMQLKNGSYRPAGRLLEKWYPNGINSQYEWNADGSLSKQKNRINYDDASVVSRHEYGYTGLGQRQNLLEKVGSLAQRA